ncbi:Histone deacetylase clr3 [Phlyctema vagabunda]|uniref:histone deacetylase n=1 Tax=Phlyctema vagabunda TaxID=108571 RepID=A0ABR4PD84_9HELO
MQQFKEAGLVYTGPEGDLAKILRDSPTKWMWRIPAREATRAEICTLHHVNHYDWVKSLEEKSSVELRQLTSEMDQGRRSLYVGNLTHMAALISAGGAIETCKNVVAGTVKNAIAVIRPPGHHAEPTYSMGFCIFNNVPIAAKVCMLEYPDICRKVLILDWDVHHGNGIQTMFYEDPNVLYISLHVYMDGVFYPGQPEDDTTVDGGMNNVGAGPGIGRNVNIPWDAQGMGDGEYLAAFQRIVMPIAQEFDPDLVIVSAGFDAAAGDELGGCYVSPSCYAHMTHMLMSLANGKVAVCLEGGYNLRAISKSALAVAKTLMGEPPARISIKDHPLNETADKVLKQVQRHQAPYWECMRDGVTDISLIKTDGVDLNEISQSSKRRELHERFQMVSLYVQREGLSRSFKDQVLVTPSLWEASKILLLVHDPADIICYPDRYKDSVDAEVAWQLDGTASYIEWAISQGFAVVDVNVPMYRETINPATGVKDKLSEQALEIQLKELLLYLWDNYLSIPPDDTPVILMGVGNSYLGIKQLLISRPAATNKRVQGILAFVKGSLKSVKSETDPTLSKWYKDHSLIYVSPNHSVFSDYDSAKKVGKKKFGNVVKADVSGLREMLKRYGPTEGGGLEAVEFILEKCGDLDDEETDDEDGK